MPVVDDAAIKDSYQAQEVEITSATIKKEPTQSLSSLTGSLQREETEQIPQERAEKHEIAHQEQAQQITEQKGPQRHKVTCQGQQEEEQVSAQRPEREVQVALEKQKARLWAAFLG